MKTLPIDVYTAAEMRLERIFTDFDNIYVSFSGGKDSGVLLNLVLDYAQRHHVEHKIGIYHFDYEAQYSATTEYVDAVFEQFSDRIIPLRCCVPTKCATSTSMFESFWRPWDESKRELWVREMPQNAFTASDFDFMNDEISDYDFNDAFSSWYHHKQQAHKTCVLVGIRAEESLDRWRTIAAEANRKNYQDLPWTTQIDTNIYAAYPIYDWKVEDVWAANARFKWDYNRLYDLFYYAGVPLSDMRVASPFNSYAKSSLALYRTLDPDTWGKMVSRVNGVNFTALYGGTTAMGWQGISKPEHFTWQQYAIFLLDTLPQHIAENYRQKLATSIKFWRDKGGVLSEEAIEDLRTAGIDFSFGGKSNYKTDKTPVKMDYIDDIDSKEFRLIPTWKRLCITILKNDHVGKYMGFSQTKRESELRQRAIEKYKEI